MSTELEQITRLLNTELSGLREGARTLLEQVCREKPSAKEVENLLAELEEHNESFRALERDLKKCMLEVQHET